MSHNYLEKILYQKTTIKTRRRRTEKEIQRTFECPYKDCQQLYASRDSLRFHIKKLHKFSDEMKNSQTLDCDPLMMVGGPITKHRFEVDKTKLISGRSRIDSFENFAEIEKHFNDETESSLVQDFEKNSLPREPFLGENPELGFNSFDELFTKDSYIKEMQQTRITNIGLNMSYYSEDFPYFDIYSNPIYDQFLKNRFTRAESSRIIGGYDDGNNDNENESFCGAEGLKVFND